MSRGRSGRLWTAANWTMAGLFALSLVVQLNDPDPLRWILLYGAAAVVCGLEARRARSWPFAAVLVLVSLAWAAWIAADLEIVPVATLFDTWEMRDTAVEETREVGGLLIVAAWSAAVVIAAWRRSRASSSGPASGR